MSVRMLCHRVFVLRNVGFLVRREFSAAASENLKESPTRLPLTMSAWQIKAYNGISSLELVDNLDLPPITKPNDVLVEVRAASINTLDVMMTEGYGHHLFNSIKWFNIGRPIELQSANLPLTLGRDFAGVVQAVGEDVKEFKPGDEVMGVVSPTVSGSHKQFVVTTSTAIKIKPSNLTMEQAASIPYAGLTAYSALNVTGELFWSSRNKRVLILGASGGVGTIAVQLCKSWGAMVVGTGPGEAMSLLIEVGCDAFVDFMSPDADSQLHQFGGFDIVLDCTGRNSNFDFSLLRPWYNAKYITLSPPVLRNFDDRGLVLGAIKSGLDLFAANSTAIIGGKTLRWAFFVPSSSGLAELRDLAANMKLRPVIDSIFRYDQMPDAYARMKAGNTLGKVVVQY